jgi:hypothetical protein
MITWMMSMTTPALFIVITPALSPALTPAETPALSPAETPALSPALLLIITHYYSLLLIINHFSDHGTQCEARSPYIKQHAMLTVNDMHISTLRHAQHPQLTCIFHGATDIDNTGMTPGGT